MTRIRPLATSPHPGRRVCRWPGEPRDRCPRRLNGGGGVAGRGRARPLEPSILDWARPSGLSSVENVELETDKRRFHKEIYFILTINNRLGEAVG